jgi:hypothetical protein
MTIRQDVAPDHRGPQVKLGVTDGGSLLLLDLAISSATFSSTLSKLDSPGSRLSFSGVTIFDDPGLGMLSENITVGADGVWLGQLFTNSTFTVLSGPCTVTEAGRCAGRPDGYGKHEACEIGLVGGGGAAIGSCPIYDIADSEDAIGRLPGGDCPNHPEGADCVNTCPLGLLVPPGGTVRWASDYEHQGNYGGQYDNGCGSHRLGTGACGAAGSAYGVGGGWLMCIA